jgi:hypothetical protein
MSKAAVERRGYGIMSGILYTKWFWGLLCLIFCSILSFQIGEQSAISRNNAGSAQFEQFLGQLDANTRQKLAETPSQDSPSDDAMASIGESGH